MHRLISYRTVLILILMLTYFLIHGNAAAKCPDPCPQQTGSGTIVDNPDMSLKWAPGHPPSEISPGETLDVVATGGLPPYTWNISGSGVSLTSDNPTNESKNKISTECSATGAATITLSDSKKDNQSNFINTISGSVNADSARFQFDSERFGADDGIARNSNRIIYVIGGAPPFRWTISRSGFYFDKNRSEQEIVTEGRSVKIYTSGSACGSTAVQITDSCGNSTTGYVRCSYGRWTTKSTPSCPIPGPQNAGTSYRIEGKYRVRQVYQETWMRSTGVCEKARACSELDCEERCSTNSNCHETMGCTECITFRPRSHTPYGQFPCAGDGPCGDNTYKTNRCYCTSIFYLYEWVCR